MIVLVFLSIKNKIILCLKNIIIGVSYDHMDYDYEKHTVDKETNSMIRDDPYSVFESTPFL